VSTENHVLWEGKGQFRGGKRHPIVKNTDTVDICAKTAEPFEMPFGLLLLLLLL